MTLMSLSDDDVARLLRQVKVTREIELSCDQCLDRIADFAECESSGTTSSGPFDAVRQHLMVCAECQDEYEMLKRVLDDEAGAADG